MEPYACKLDTEIPVLAGLLLIWTPEAPTSVQMSEWSRFNLSVHEIKEKIDQLNVARSRRRIWIVGTSLCALAITTICLLIIRNAALSLLQDGPTHDEFIVDLTRQITKQVLPQMDESGIQASCKIFPSADPYSPIPRHPHASGSGSGTDEVQGPSSRMKSSPSATAGEKTNVGICDAADDPQKPLGHFREQTVSEYQATVTRIVNDLVAIRSREGNDTHAGLPPIAVAGLFVSRVQEGLPKPPLEDYSPRAGSQSSRDAR